jgi:dTDP-4-dehydrorhamnose 3,5-epimerase
LDYVREFVGCTQIMFELRETGIAGFVELKPNVKSDVRGTFVKTFHQAFFEVHGLETQFREHYYSVSRRRVLRGLHFQLPPNDQAKLVFCIAGEIIDVALDLRTRSPTFGEHRSVTIGSEQANQVYLARGLAHGFYVLSDSATVVYNVTTLHAPAYDTGIHWNSAGIRWPDDRPIVSERDSTLSPWKAFLSPFI